MQSFKLHDRAKHVFEEAERVHKFEEACKKGDLQLMGRLMNESHRSCKNLYECSCPELDELVKKCRDVNCTGARLTGAGLLLLGIYTHTSVTFRLGWVFGDPDQQRRQGTD